MAVVNAGTVQWIEHSFRFALEHCTRKGSMTMSNNWITTATAVAMISKNSHHQVSPSHLQILVNRGKIGTRSLQGGTILLKRSDVETTHVAAGTGNSHKGKH